MTELPKAEDVYRDSWNLLASGDIDQPAIIHAMHEYCKLLVDFIAENTNVVDKKDILKFKDMLK